MSEMNPTSSRAAAAFALLACMLTSTAWGAYKIVGPDGRVTYTDRPPAADAAQPIGKPRSSAQAGTAPLPYELQQAVNRHPVTLYTMRECQACDSARQLLQNRGVPYTEKTVDTPEDIRAFNTQEGTSQMPLLKIGSKQLIGLQKSEWESYLSAAGYPQQSKLPPGYTQPAPTPLAPPKPLTEERREPSNDGTRPFAPTIGNPPEGFRF